MGMEALEPRRLLAYILDPGFGDGGYAPVKAFELLHPLPDRRILTARQDGAYQFTLVRLNADGTIDDTFQQASEPPDSIGDSNAVISGDRILLSSFTEPAGPNQRVVAYVRALKLSDGSIDTSFGEGGIIRFVPKPFSDLPNYYLLGGALAAAGDGSILISFEEYAGDPWTEQQGAYAIVKIDPTGRIDTGFADEGTLRYALGNYPTPCAGPGDTFYVLSNTMTHGVVSRHNLDDGSLDTSFNTGLGYVPINVATGSISTHLRVQDDGKILVASDVNNDFDTDDDAYLTRLNPDGSFDSSFGGDGTLLFNNEFSVYWNTDPQGRIIGYTGADRIFRLTADGEPDTSFGTAGSIQWPEDIATDLIDVGANGDILIGGTATRGIFRLVSHEAGATLSPDRRIDIDGTDGDDVVTVTLSGDNYVVTINGTSSQFAVSSALALVIDTWGGNDAITNDTALSSTINAGAANDTVFGGSGSDRIHGNQGADSLWGRDGADRLYGEDGVDSMYGNGGNDRLEGGAQGDHMRGNGGRDMLFGNGGHDRMYGGAGGDRIYGQAGNDRIFGEGGNDRLYGDDGFVDSLYGGAGDDVFITLDGVIDHLFGDGGDDTANADEEDVLTSIVQG